MLHLDGVWLAVPLSQIAVYFVAVWLMKKAALAGFHFAELRQ